MIYENDKQKYILARNLGVNSATQTKNYKRLPA